MTNTLQRIAKALDNLDEAYEASAALQAEFPEYDRPPEVQALCIALDYLPSRSSDTERREQWGVFTPMIETTAGVYPPPPTAIQQAIRSHWVSLADGRLSSVATARLCDLLWELHDDPRPDVWARRAASEYLALAERVSPESMVREEYLVRASEIARNLNDAGLQRQAAAACVQSLVEALDSRDHVPGVVIGLLEELIRLPHAAQPRELPDLIDQALSRYSSDPWLTDTLTDLALSRAHGDLQRRRELEDLKIRAWANAAEQQEGLIAATHLERAIALAHHYGHSDMATELRIRRQEIGRSIELQKISAAVEVPSAEVQAFIAAFVGEDLDSSLRRLASYCPLPESRDATVEFVRETMRQHPLLYHHSTVVMGPTNNPIHYVNTPDEHFYYALSSHESWSVEIWGLFAADVLDAILQAHTPSREAIAGYLAANSITSTVAEPITEAIELYREARYDAALMTALPRVETIVRHMSQRLGLVVFVEPRGGRPGKLKGLGDLLFVLKGRFDELRRHYLHVLLTEPLANNLRNSGLHGILIKGSREQAALAIHACLLFTLFELQSSPAQD
jgi:hypothetical protein